ncbi:hypothetical protein [Streptomyces sp. NPDC005438]|uniref:hypothetical protein n=1 Tax=Streptomyces sp. NPDC005438 TaxID=3156880 RepID=UPI0033B9557B
MTTLITTPILNGPEAAASSCPLANELPVSAVSGGVKHDVLLGADRVVRERNMRPSKAFAAVQQASVGQAAYVAAGAFAGQQNKQILTIWALRGLEPWRDPA